MSKGTIVQDIEYKGAVIMFKLVKINTETLISTRGSLPMNIINTVPYYILLTLIAYKGFLSVLHTKIKQLLDSFAGN